MFLKAVRQGDCRQEMSTFGQRLRQVRGKLSRERFAVRLGTSVSSIRGYEADKHDAPQSFLMRVTREFSSVNEAWLISGRGEMGGEAAEPQRPYRHERSVSATGPSDLSADQAGQFMLVPIWSVEASSGFGSYVGREEARGYLAFSREWLTRNSPSGTDSLCVVFNRGDSNAPDINHGDALLVDRGAEKIVDDAYYVFDREGALLVKMIERMVDGRLALKSRDAAYEPQMLSREEAARLRVFGRVRWRGGVL